MDADRPKKPGGRVMGAPRWQEKTIKGNAMKFQQQIWILYVFLLVLLLSGCDGLHRSRTNINFTENKVSSISKVQVSSPNELFPLIETIARKHGMQCHPYDEYQKVVGCGVGGFNLLTYVKPENLVTIELSEFGPWGETKRYQALKTVLSEMLEKLYPGQGIVLQSVPLK